MTRDEMINNKLVQNATYENDFIDLLAELAAIAPLAHTVFAKEQSLPYSIWDEDGGEFIFADGKIIRGFVNITLEVYHASNDTETISKIENILKKYEKLYSSESVYIEKEKCKMTMFEFTVRKV